MKRLTIEFKDEQALVDYVYNLADAGLVPDGADVYPKDALDRTPGDYLIRSTQDGRINGILGRADDETA